MSGTMHWSRVARERKRLRSQSAEEKAPETKAAPTPRGLTDRLAAISRRQMDRYRHNQK